MGLSPDSATYLSGADHLAAGAGFVNHQYKTPITVSPPGYSLLLAAGSLIGISTKEAARLWGALLFALTTSIVSYLAFRFTGSLIIATALGTVAFSSKDLIHAFSMVHTEAPFLVVISIYILLAVKFLEMNRLSDLILMSFLASVATMIRYVGAYLILTSAFLAVIRNSTIRSRVRSLAICAVSSIPLILWFFRNAMVSKHLYVERTDSSMSFSEANMWKAVSTMKGWAGPEATFVLLFVFIFLASVSFKKERPKEMRPPMILAAALILSYVSVLIASVWFLKIATPFDQRILLPVFIPALLLTFLIFHYVSAKARPAFRSSEFRKVGGVLCIASLVFFVMLSVRLARGYSNPLMVRGFTWHTGPLTIQAFKQLDPGPIVFSNADDYIYLFTGKPAYRLPMVYRIDDPSQRMPDYDSKIKTLIKLIGKDGIIVYFNRHRRAYVPSEADLMRILPMDVVTKTKDGIILKVNKKMAGIGPDLKR